jgi:hypothetical protein
VDKRITVLAGMMQMGATIYDLEEAEMCYAPEFGSTKDRVNFAGTVAVEKLPGSVHIPIGERRAGLGELPRDLEIHVVCPSGRRAYIATRMLLLNGFKAKTVSAGCRPWRQLSHRLRRRGGACSLRLDQI